MTLPLTRRWGGQKRASLAPVALNNMKACGESRRMAAHRPSFALSNCRDCRIDKSSESLSGNLSRWASLGLCGRYISQFEPSQLHPRVRCSWWSFLPERRPPERAVR